MEKLIISLLVFVSFFTAKCFGNYCDADDMDCRSTGHHSGMYGKLLVAALDFGTTYSSWAFALKHEHARDPTDITFRHWPSGEHFSLKTPTTVLIKPDGKTLDSFGYEAETRYADLAANDEQFDYYYFRQFKMLLHGIQRLSRDTTLEDEKGHVLPAMTVFALAIQFLKEDMMEALHKRDLGIEDSDVSWVLTVPAIWNDGAKQFMREAAVQAGIDTNSLRIALEPEAASLFCRLEPAEKVVDESGSSHIIRFTPGTKYMVVDAGGGTVDINVHEVMNDGNLKELSKASGGPWGGTLVDKHFIQFLTTILGNEVLDEFKRRCEYDYLGLMRDFELNKRSVSPNKKTDMRFRVPECLRNVTLHITGESIAEKITSSKFKGVVRAKLDKIHINAEMAKTFFKNSLESIRGHIKRLLEEPIISETSAILLVGGFSDSPMLQHVIKSSFPNRRVIVPKDAALVVVKGAVIFGYKPSVVVERVCKYTYGVDITSGFIEGKHDRNKRIFVDNRAICTDLFDKYVEMGQSVRLGQQQGQKLYVPLYEHQETIPINVYACEQTSPMYVTDEGCLSIGYITVYLKQRSVPKNQRTVMVSLIFTGTEIGVNAVEMQTGEKTSSSIDFLG